MTPEARVQLGKAARVRAGPCSSVVLLAAALLVLTPHSAPPACAQAAQGEGPLDRAAGRAGELIERGREAIGLGQEDPEGSAATGIVGGVPFLARFKGSVGALQPGAPVDVLGMRMGTVREVRAVFDPATTSFDIPVVFELDPAPFVAGEKGAAATEKVYAAVDAMVRQGLRARIGTYRLLQGDMLLRLDTERGASPAELRRDGATPEVPAAAAQPVGLGAQLDGVLARLNALPMEQAVLDLQAAAGAARRMVESPELREAVARLSSLVAAVEQQAGPLMARLDEVTRSATVLAGQAQSTVAGTNRLLADSRGLPDQLEELLRELASMARSTRILVDYLERHPDALLRGKAGDGS
jgi:paraquat-inducible protein B